MSEDEIGYKRPPKASQFKAGKSGNPRGRPKGSTSFKADLVAEMREQITVHDKNGRPKRISRQRALIKLLVSSALRSEKGSMSALLTCIRIFGAGNEGSIREEHDVEDIDMLKQFVRRAEARQQQEQSTATTEKKSRRGGH